MTVMYDKLSISGTRRTEDGYLVADVRVARTGVQDYLGVEVDRDGSLGLRDRQVVRVYRPEEEVFSQDSMRSYAHRPVTNDHPSEMVTADNWRKLSVGQTGGDVVRDKDWVRVPMVLMDGETISQVEGGKRQLSMGYMCVIDTTPGVAPDGTEYDVVQRGLRMNHLAVVTAARAGPMAKIGDVGETAPSGASLEDRRMTVTTQKVVVDGITIETTDQGAQVIAKLQKQMSDAAAKHDKALADKDAEIAKKDADIAKKDAEIDDLKAKIMTGDALDAAVAARADLIDRAKRIAPSVETRGLSDSAIKKAVVVARVGDTMKDKSEAYIDARFDMLADESNTTDDAQTQLRLSLASTKPIGDAKLAYDQAVAASVANLNAHRSK